MSTAVGFRGYREWKGWTAESFGVCGPVQAAYYAAELARARLETGRPLDVMEVGFGNGEFAGWAHAQGFSYTGSELVPELRRQATAAGFRVYDGDCGRLPADLGPQSLDLVVAFDVLEHLELEALEALLAGVHVVLRPGGCLLARVPSGDSPFGRATQHGDLTHRLTLGTSAVEQLAARHRFLVVDVGAPRLPLRGVGLRRAARRALLLAAQKMIGGIINATFHANQRRVITGSLVFVLRKPAGTATAQRDDRLHPSPAGTP
jgi:SAM-dependent methyltransferase